MKYRNLFESEEVKNLTHEVLTAHGLKHRHGAEDSHHYEDSHEEPHVHEEKIDELHDALHGIGWKHRSTKNHQDDFDPDMAGADEHRYTHRAMPGHRLEITHTYRHDGGEDEDGNDEPFSHVHATIRKTRR